MLASKLMETVLAIKASTPIWENGTNWYVTSKRDFILVNIPDDKEIRTHIGEGDKGIFKIIASCNIYDVMWVKGLYRNRIFIAIHIAS